MLRMQTTHDGNPVWAGFYYRLDSKGKEVYYDVQGGDENVFTDVVFFETLPNGEVKELGRVESKPLLEVDSNQINCEFDFEFDCDSWSLIEKFFVSDEFVFVFINDQIVKLKVTEKGLEELNRFYLHASPESDKPN